MQALKAFINRRFDVLLVTGVMLLVLGNVVSMATTGVDLFEVGAPLVLGFVVLGLAAFGFLALVFLVFGILFR